MGREAILIGAMVLMSLLVLVKYDQQIVTLLKAKLFKRGENMDTVALVYQKHKRAPSVVFFVMGGAAIGLSIILLTKENGLFPFVALLSVSLICLGIWGRISSFRAAGRELDDAGNISRGEAGKTR